MPSRSGTRRRLAASIVVLAALGGTMPRAQAPAVWSELAIPAGTSVPSSGGLGKLVTYLEGSTLHVYSALRRRWSSASLGSAAAVRTSNDCLLVMASGTWLAFSSHRGEFEPLTVSSQAQLLNSAANTNDSVWLVADHGQLHAFSGFTGVWHSRPLAPVAQWSVARHTAILAQGTLLSGFDAFRGEWVDLNVAATPTTVDANGTAGFAVANTEVHAFSATHRKWTRATLPPNATMIRADDWVVFHGADQLLGYSAIRSSFATRAAKVTGTLAVQDLFALLDTTLGPLSFAAIAGGFGGPWAGPGTPVVASAAMALLDTPAGLLAYSAVLDDARLLARSLGARDCANAVGYAIDGNTGRPVLYSALTGAWSDVPDHVMPGPPVLTTTAVGLTTNQGGMAFGARTGQYVPLSRAGLSLAGNPSSAPLLAWDHEELFAFDARRDRWLATPRAASGPVQPAIWRTTAMVIDGNVVFGFGALGGAWSSQLLPEPIVASRANSESGRINTTTRVFAYSPLPDVVPMAQFPEFRRVQPVGTELRLVLPVPATALVVLGAGTLVPVPIALPGLGELHLAGPGLATVPIATDPTGAPVTLMLTLPTAASMFGLQWAFQAVVMPPNGVPWLGTPATVLPW